MGRESEDKAARILSIYSRLQQGKVICKKKESVEYQVAERTIQRDIADIQCYLQEQVQETGEIQEIVYDKSLGGYVLQTKSRMQLDEKEILAVAKVLLESRSMIKKELFPIIHKLVALCNDETKERFLEEVLKNEMFHYVELQHGKEILEVLWELEQAVKRQEYIEIRYRKVKNHAEVVRKVKPVGVMFSEFYFYLTAYIEDGDFAYPTIYRIDRFMKITRLDEYFTVPYADRFEEGEFKKRIQFMYGGKLRKIKFLYTGDSIDAVLDRLPTAEILEKRERGVVVRAEVFGDGIDMWLRSQGDMVEMM